MNTSQTSQGDRLAVTFLAVTAWLGCTLLISMPGGIYLANSGEFTIDTSSFFKFTVPLFLAGMLIASIIYFITPRVARRYYVSILFAVAAMTWVQGNILIWDYGPLDGRAISWDVNRSKGYVDGAIWLTVLTLSVVIPRIFLKAALAISLFILAYSLSMVGLALLQQSDNTDVASIKNYQIDDANKFNFSSERNVILIVLDAFQSDVFAEVIDDSEFASQFDGFVYFPNSLAASNFTQISIPTLLTGKMYDNTLPRSDYMRDAFLEFGITTLLKRNGLAVDIYPWVGWGNETIHFDESVASNLKLKTLSKSKARTYSEQNAKEVLHLIDLTLFRISPHFLKRYIYNDQKWFTIQIATALVPTSVKQTISTDDEFETSAFVREAVERTRQGSPQAAFKYYHVKGAHQPLTVNADLSFSSTHLPFNRSNYISSVKANINSVGEFIGALKANNVFDNSTIIIVGDHGSGITPDVYIEPGETGNRIAGSKRNFQKDKARGVPLMLVKRVAASGPITVNDAPVSLSDVPATILSELGIEGPAIGRPVFDIAAEESRIRTFGAFDFNAAHSDYVGPITMYEVDGNSWHDSSWSVTGVNHPRSAE